MRESVHVPIESIEFPGVEHKTLREGLGEQDVGQIQVCAIEDGQVAGDGGRH